jgi:thioredoxin 1
MNPSDSNSNTWLLACLCAAWCSACGEYRNTFDALAREREGSARFIWVDIEDNEQALGSIDVVDFPTLLIAHGDNIVFFGPVTPYLQTARQLLLRAQRGQLDMRYDPGLAGLAARISSLG